MHADLEACLGDTSRPPLEQLRCFFDLTQQTYQEQGYMGCLLGGLGQELSGINEEFRRAIEACFSELADQFTCCLDAARGAGDIPIDTDTRQMANVLADSWEGAALRSRLRRESAPLTAMLDFYLGIAVGRPSK